MEGQHTMCVREGEVKDGYSLPSYDQKQYELVSAFSRSL
jgi:hypothetical protein